MAQRFVKSARNHWRSFTWAIRGLGFRVLYMPIWSCGGGLMVGPGVDIEIYGTLIIGQHVILWPGCYLSVGPGATLELGDYVSVGRNTVVRATEHITIGTWSLIGEHCTVRDSDHQIKAEARTPEFESVTSPIVIGERVWIAAGVRVLRGTHLKQGVVVGANAVVRETFGPNQVIGGIPARVVRAI